MPDQPSLPMEIPEPVKRTRKRRSSRRNTPSSRRGEQTLTLLQQPVVERCAMCGHKQTVFGDAAVCDSCGGMVFREEAAQGDG
ncbi:MAG: hypothetical protein GF393_11550 [Armatimonadia bacterium]|nr:hypothetical protein [Armatimonadia bacterium]